MAIRVLKAGVFDTVQDLGRFGYAKLGINSGGAMDIAAVRLINTLLGNSGNAAVLEMHFPAPELRFEESRVFALGGGDFEPELGGRPLNNWEIRTAMAGETLCFRRNVSGGRTYLAVLGGLSGEEWLGSKSTNLFAQKGGIEGRRLVKGDVIEIRPSDHQRLPPEGVAIGPGIVPPYSSAPSLRVLEGPEYHMLTALGGDEFESGRFRITADSNRMGYRLVGKSLHTMDGAEILSSAVDFGTIQLLPNGRMIILMADRQTTGGYPRIANIIGADLSLAAQLKPGDSAGFRIVPVAEAEYELMRFERDLRFLRLGVRFKSPNA